jgi:hypothetical protein
VSRRGRSLSGARRSDSRDRDFSQGWWSFPLTTGAEATGTEETTAGAVEDMEEGACIFLSLVVP